MTQRLRSKIRTALGKKNKSAKRNGSEKSLPDNAGEMRGGTKNGKESAVKGVATDEVEEASMESFPASDAPSWTPVASTGSGAEDSHDNVDKDHGTRTAQDPKHSN